MNERDDAAPKVDAAASTAPVGPGCPPAGMPVGAGGPPAGVPVGAGGPPAGIPMGAGGPPAGVPVGAGGPPAGIPMGAGGPPAGIPVGAGGPPAGVPGPPPGVSADGVPMVDATSGASTMPAFGQAYAQAINSGQHEQLALWYIDIHNFRSVNPKFGFLGGNLVLRSLVAGFREVICHDLPIVRLGADRFVMLSATRDYDEAQSVFDAALARINAMIAEGGIDYEPVLTAGVYFYDEMDMRNPSFQRALDYVSIAHRNAHLEHTSNVTRFTEEDHERDVRRIIIEQGIDEALITGQIQVWYQPQVDYLYGEVIGAEALARWHHPELGWISPAEFIPVLENCGKVHDLDLFVWEEACRNAGRWRNVSDGKPVPISVNVSRAEMFQPHLMEHFLELQTKYDLPAGSLHLEVTESAFVEEADRLYGIIETMRRNNLMVEMDDFGSGLSSLNMLKDVPVDVVKLDMGFMRSSVNQERGGVVLGSVIRMLQGLDTPIIAEGVETLEQAEMLKNMGCHLMQGFHFSRPMPLEDFEEFVASANTTEESARRIRRISHLDELTSVDPASSFIFNNAIGGMLYFFAGNGTSESILVNDAFYEECGLSRGDFGNTKINPIQEIDSDSQASLWRAAAEARERGSAYCSAQVRLTGRWFEGVMRYLGASSRGDVYSLNIVRSGKLEESDARHDHAREAMDAEWTFTLLDKVGSNGFLKCRMDDQLTLDYLSPRLMERSGLAADEFQRRFHNSFAEIITRSDRARVLEAMREGQATGETVECGFRAYQGYTSMQHMHLIGRVQRDENGTAWLYALLILKGEATEEEIAQDEHGDIAIPFDYYVDEDRLVIHSQQSGSAARDVVVEGWLSDLEQMPANMSRQSAARILALARDLRSHPSSGFCDIKCNLRGGETMRWYHVDYSCEADAAGNTHAVHGYAQDADDQMGSARWWRRQAEIDQLTGLLNRNASEQEINLSIRTNGSGMMFMIDLDGFKRVNDELGHLVGDALLRDVAGALAEHFRESDVLGRYGGDEFVAFVPCPSEIAHELAERRSAELIAAVESVQIPDGTHAACSVGVAVCDHGDATFYDLLETADQAMYASKMAGKGIYSVADM